MIEHRLGQGGMAAVFAARHVALGKRVAIKMLLPHCAARDEIARRFVREGESVARLFHPHVVDVTDVGTNEHGSPYLVMEYLEGEDLGALLQRRRKLSVEEAADLIVPVTSAVAAAHDAGIVHRDLKPQNLFLARERDSVVPKVLDFGVSKLMDSESIELTGSGTILGTPHYLSPEQAQSQKIDKRTDQFSLGVILYECVAGRRPFEGETPFSVIANIVAGRPVALSKLVRGIDPRFEALVHRALHKDPNKRFADMRALGHELAQCASFRTRIGFGRELGLPSEEPKKRSSPASRRYLRRAALLGSGVGGLTVLALLTFVLPRLPPSASPLASTAQARPLEGATVSVPDHSQAPEVVEPEVVEHEPASTVSSDPLARYELVVSVKPRSALLTLDGEPLGVGQVQTTLPSDGVEHVLEARRAGFRPLLLRFRDAAPATRELVLERLPLPATALSSTSGPARPLLAEGADVPSPAKVETDAALAAPTEPPTTVRYGNNRAMIVR